MRCEIKGNWNTNCLFTEVDWAFFFFTMTFWPVVVPGLVEWVGWCRDRWVFISVGFPECFSSILHNLQITHDLSVQRTSLDKKKKYMCVSGFPTLPRFLPRLLNILSWIVGKILSNLLKNGEKCIEKCHFYIKYFDKIKCYADWPCLVFFQSWNLKHTHIFCFLP